MMKKLMALLLVCMLFVFPAHAQELPDTGICLCADGVLAAQGVDLGNGFVGDIWVYEHNAETAEGVEIWLYLADLEEFLLAETTPGFSALTFGRPGGGLFFSFEIRRRSSLLSYYTVILIQNARAWLIAFSILTDYNSRADAAARLSGRELVRRWFSRRRLR